MSDTLDVNAVADKLRGHTPEVIVLPTPTDSTAYQDSSTIIVVPTRGRIDHRVVESWLCTIKAMNQKYAYLFSPGREVGEAYNAAVERVLADPVYSRWPFIATWEDDNVLEPHSFVALLETIQRARTSDGLLYDAVSAVYCTKDAARTPLVLGDWNRWKATGEMSAEPVDLSKYPQHSVVPTCMIPQGCAIWRMDLFRHIPAPWFHTSTRDVHAKLASWRSNRKGYKKVGIETQDGWFGTRATRDHGARFGVDLAVVIGHLDVNSGIVHYPRGMEPK